MVEFHRFTWNYLTGSAQIHLLSPFWNFFAENFWNIFHRGFHRVVFDRATGVSICSMILQFTPNNVYPAQLTSPLVGHILPLSLRRGLIYREIINFKKL